MDIGTIRGLITLALMTAFIALAVWLFLFRKRADFEHMANIPLEKDDNGERNE